MNEAERIKKEVIGILQRALAGYTKDYKIEIKGQTYIQWGIVQKDIEALFEESAILREYRKSEVQEGG